MNMLKDNATEEARIRDVIEARSAALRRKDARAVIAQQAEGHMNFSLAPPLVSDWNGAGDLNAWFETWEGPLGYEFRELSTAVSGDIAFCHGLARLSGAKVGGPKDLALWFRLSLCFRKVGGQWKIVHEHESVPFYMDGSLRAAVDLAP